MATMVIVSIRSLLFTFWLGAFCIRDANVSCWAGSRARIDSLCPLFVESDPVPALLFVFLVRPKRENNEEIL